jgi:L-threonylcarbamoyladenylate synthase
LVEVLSVDGARPQPAVMARAIEALARGALLIFPTDTLYALGGRALDGNVGQCVRAAKGRGDDKPLPVVAADLAQVQSLCRAWPAVAEALAIRFWPGPLTLIVPAAASVPSEVTSGSAGLALRVPGLELPRALCRAVGPLICTSANRSGEPPARDCDAAVRAVGDFAELALDAGVGQDAASTILDLTSDPATLLRQGPIAWEDLEPLLRLHAASGT